MLWKGTEWYFASLFLSKALCTSWKWLKTRDPHSACPVFLIMELNRSSNIRGGIDNPMVVPRMALNQLRFLPCRAFIIIKKLFMQFSIGCEGYKLNRPTPPSFPFLATFTRLFFERNTNSKKIFQIDFPPALLTRLRGISAKFSCRQVGTFYGTF